MKGWWSRGTKSKRSVLGDSRRRLGRRCGCAPSERDISPFGVDSDRVALAELALQQHHRQRVLYEALNRALQGTGSIDRVPTTLREQLACGISDHEVHPSVRQPVFESLQLNIDDGGQLLLGQRLEDDHLVDAVEKLGAEVFSQHGDHRVTHSFEVLAGHLLDQWATEIRRHDQNRVAEVDGPALAIRQTSIVEDLQQDVEDVRVRLLDLVEEHHRIRPPANQLRQLTTLVLADVARRRTEHAGDGVLFLVLRHVQPDQRLFIIEEELGQRAGELGLAHTGRAEKDEGAHWPVWAGA